MDDKEYLNIAYKKKNREAIHDAAFKLVGEQRVVKAHGINDALYQVLNLILEKGDSVFVKDNNLLEISPLTVHLINPLDNMPLLAYRYNNPFACIAETLWVLSGRDDIEFLSYYLPRAKDYSDDGKVWRGGYGPRLRRYGRHPGSRYLMSDSGVDQLKHVIDVLKEDINSRQAVIIIYDPATDHEQVGMSKDIPCNNWIQFIVRNNKLHCYTSVRSNDMMWGFSGINVFEWTTIQSFIAYNLDVEVGNYYHFTGSAHLYERHWDRARQLVKYYGDAITALKALPNELTSPYLKIPLSELSNELNKFFEIRIKLLQRDVIIPTDGELSMDKYQYFHLLYAYDYYKKSKYEYMKHIFDKLKPTAIKLACLHYLLRTSKGIAYDKVFSCLTKDDFKYLSNRKVVKDQDPITGVIKWL